MDRDSRIGFVASIVEKLALTRGGGYFWCVLQLLGTLFAVTRWPRVAVDIITVNVHMAYDPIFNQTMVSQSKLADVDVWHGAGIATIFIAVSVGTAFFGVLTMQVAEHREGASLSDEAMHISGYADFSSQNEELMGNPSFAVWNFAFFVTVLVFHMMIVAVVCTPTTAEFALFASFAAFIPLVLSCRPRSPQGTRSFAGPQTCLLVHVLVVGAIISRIPYDPWSYRVQLLCIVLFINCFFLLLGHSWDPGPVMETVFNCRLVYVCIISALNLLVYVYWNPMLSTRYTQEV